MLEGNRLKTTRFILSFHAPVGRHQRMKMASLGSWFDRLTTSGWDPVRLEPVEGRTAYFQSSEAKQASSTEIASGLGPSQ